MGYITKNILSVLAIVCLGFIVFFPEPSDHLSPNQLMTITAIIIFFIALPIMRIVKAVMVPKK